MRIHVNLHKTTWVGRWQFYDPNGLFSCIFAWIYIIFCDFVYGVIHIDLVCRSVGYFVFVRIQTIYLQSTCVLSLSLSSLKSVSELLISIYFHSRLGAFQKRLINCATAKNLQLCEWDLSSTENGASTISVTNRLTLMMPKSWYFTCIVTHLDY